MGRSLEVLTWAQVRDAVCRINPELATLIDAISPNQRYKLIKANYAYGELIVDRGQLNVSLYDAKQKSKLTQLIAKQLAHCKIPLSLILSKAVEVFTHTAYEQQNFPLKLIMPGDLFGLFEMANYFSGIESIPIWSVSCGAKTAFMLPKLSDSMRHQHLSKQFGISSNPPLNLWEQTDIFSQLMQSKMLRSQWGGEIIFFADNWLQPQKDSLSWRDFHNFLIKRAWLQASYSQDSTLLDLAWQFFSIELGKRNIKPRPYLVNTMKHLIGIALGAFPGFVPAIDNTAIPSTVLGKVYQEVYGLSNYIATFMHPYVTHYLPNRLLYYSLSMPILLEGYPPHKKPPQIMSDLRALSHIADILLNTVKTGIAQNFIGSSYDKIEAMSFNFYHITKDIYKETGTIEKLLLTDPSFKHNKMSSNQKLCHSSRFFNGCVQILSK